MFVGVGDDSSFFEVLEGSIVASFFHEEKLFSIPGIEVDRLDEGVDDAVLTMLAGAVETQMDAQVDRGPLRVLLLAVQTDLRHNTTTLLSFMLRICPNTLSRTYYSTIYFI